MPPNRRYQVMELSSISAVSPTDMRGGRLHGLTHNSRPAGRRDARTSLYGLSPYCRDLFRNRANRRGERGGRSRCMVDCDRHRGRRDSPPGGLPRRKRYVRCIALSADSGLTAPQNVGHLHRGPGTTASRLDPASRQPDFDRLSPARRPMCLGSIASAITRDGYGPTICEVLGRPWVRKASGGGSSPL
jgi:hypothetical protein